MKKRCIHCDIELNYIETTKIQLGQTGWIFGDLPNLLAGALNVDIYSCPKCGKIEFYHTEASTESEMMQVKCPKCGKSHDIDYPKCPYCKYEY